MEMPIKIMGILLSAATGIIGVVVGGFLTYYLNIKNDKRKLRNIFTARIALLKEKIDDLPINLNSHKMFYGSDSVAKVSNFRETFIEIFREYLIQEYNDSNKDLRDECIKAFERLERNLDRYKIHHDMYDISLEDEKAQIEGAIKEAFTELSGALKKVITDIK